MTAARAIAEPQTLEDLEARYDGAIPQEALDLLRHGSRQDVEIARLEDSMWFFKDECRRMLRSARQWSLRGNTMMKLRNRNDAQFHLVRWKSANRRRNILRSDKAAFANATRVLDQIAQVTDESEGN